MLKADFHTHSIASPDGGMKPIDYRRALERGVLDYIAITDHNTTEMAMQLRGELGSRIIIGEEITTTKGEIIGLFLKETVPAGLSPSETVEHIREQGGLVYIPHPFETVRKGIGLHDLDEIAAQVDMIETHNGRAVFQNKSSAAQAWSERHGVLGVAGSDAHGVAGWGRTYTLVDRPPSPDNLRLLKEAAYCVARPGLRGIAYPKFNRLRKKWRRNA